MNSKSSDYQNARLAPARDQLAQLRETVEAGGGFFDQAHFVVSVLSLAVLITSSSPVTLQPPPSER